MRRQSGLGLPGGLVLAVVVLLLALLASGCGGAGNSGAPSITPVAGTVGPPTPGSSLGSSKTPDQRLADAIQAQFEGAFGNGPFILAKVTLAPDSNGGRQFLAELQVPSAAEANLTIRDVMEWFEVKAAAINHDGQAKIDGLHVNIKTPGGEMIVDWTEDLVAGLGTGHWADGINNYWFPMAAPAPAST